MLFGNSHHLHNEHHHNHNHHHHSHRHHFHHLGSDDYAAQMMKRKVKELKDEVEATTEPLELLAIQPFTSFCQGRGQSCFGCDRKDNRFTYSTCDCCTTVEGLDPQIPGLEGHSLTLLKIWGWGVSSASRLSISMAPWNKVFLTLHSLYGSGTRRRRTEQWL